MQRTNANSVIQFGVSLYAGKNDANGTNLEEIRLRLSKREKCVCLSNREREREMEKEVANEGNE